MNIDSSQKQSHLDISLGDISAEGLLLTKINPAYITRQLSELLSSKT